jgi:NodT family efflux transporter outer membrane factor (OMF) lipoprotein
MNIPRIALAVLASGTLVGCMVGPDYRAPVASPPQHWSEPLAGGETDRAAALATWWRSFGDPELDSLVERALASNLDLRAAEARVRQARAASGLADAQRWPQADLSGSAARAKESANQPLIGGALPPGTAFTSGVYQGGFDASWELDLFGGLRRGAEAADADLAAAGFSRADAQVTLVAEVARDYILARGFQQRLAIARQNLTAQRDIVNLARDRHRQGLTSDLEPEQAATVLAQTEAQVPALEAGLQRAIHHLGVLLGQQPGALQAELEAQAPIPTAPPQVPAGLPADLLRRRPDIRMAERQLAAATARIGLATADLYPKFSLTGAYGYLSTESGRLVSSDSRTWSVGPTFQWHLLDAGRVRANIRIQDARQEQALAAYQKAVLVGFEDVENALVAYAKEQARNVPLRSAVASSRNALEISRDQYANGLTSFLNVLDAERSLYQAQDTLVQSDQAVAQDLIALFKALGGGWEAQAATGPAAQLQPAPKPHGLAGSVRVTPSVLG